MKRTLAYRSIVIPIFLVMLLLTFIRGSMNGKKQIEENVIFKKLTWSQPQATVEVRQPKKQVGFLKTHKTGSTTMSMIIGRYAIKHNATIAVGNKTTGKGLSNICYPARFKPDCLYQKNVTKYDAFIHHAIFDDNVKSLLPETAFWTTILREPLSLYQSMFYFFGWGRKFGTKKKHMQFETFIRDFTKYERQLSNAYHVWYDFDLPCQNFSVEEAIDKIEREFDLVMIRENFTESLGLLSLRLNAAPEDFVSIKDINKRNPKKLPKQTENELRSIIRQADPSYAALYDHFQRKFQRLAASEATEVARRSAVIRAQNAHWSAVCRDVSTAANQSIDTREKCKALNWGFDDLHRFIQQRQANYSV